MAEETRRRSSLRDSVRHVLRSSLNAVGQKIAAQHFGKKSLVRTPRAFQIRDNVLMKALVVAVPSGAAASLIRLAYEANPDSEMWSSLRGVDPAWSSFNFLVTFLLVFKTSQASERFWEGCTACHRMKAEWFDSCSALVSFCRGSSAPPSKVANFQHSIIRMFSMLHGIALAEVEDRPEGEGATIDNIEAFGFEMIHPEAFDDDGLHALMKCPHKAQLLYQWIQCLILDNVNNGVIKAPAPIVSRAYQELASGMVAFHEALKISSIPVPLPYVQVCDWMMMLHYLFLPLLIPQWVAHWGWAFAFCFIQIFILWALKFTAAEIENPFGTDSNDLDRKQLQRDMNSALRFLLDPALGNTPQLLPGSTSYLNLSEGVSTFRDLVIRMERKSHLPRQSTERTLGGSAHSLSSLEAEDHSPRQSTAELLFHGSGGEPMQAILSGVLSSGYGARGSGTPSSSSRQTEIRSSSAEFLGTPRLELSDVAPDRGHSRLESGRSGSAVAHTSPDEPAHQFLEHRELEVPLPDASAPKLTEEHTVGSRTDCEMCRTYSPRAHLSMGVSTPRQPAEQHIPDFLHESTITPRL